MNLNAEIWLAAKLKAAGAPESPFDGMTTFEQRRERVRLAIVQHGIATKAAGKDKSGSVTFGQAFARIYGCALIAGEHAA